MYCVKTNLEMSEDGLVADAISKIQLVLCAATDPVSRDLYCRENEVSEGHRPTPRASNNSDACIGNDVCLRLIQFTQHSNRRSRPNLDLLLLYPNPVVGCAGATKNR